RRGARAAAREFRAAATADDPPRPAAPVRAWHGTRDGNTRLEPLRAFVRSAGGEVVTRETDHLGTLLDCRRDALAWLASA
ncbi:MAG: alpha/beta hydrolase, partial [Haloferacaceae archaeon]